MIQNRKYGTHLEERVPQMKKEVLTVEKMGSAKEGQEHQWTQHKLINTHPSPIRLAESDAHTFCRHSRKLRL